MYKKNRDVMHVIIFDAYVVHKRYETHKPGPGVSAINTDLVQATQQESKDAHCSLREPCLHTGRRPWPPHVHHQQLLLQEGAAASS
jgi:hypothetical protein